jgi:hypothetical protein
MNAPCGGCNHEQHAGRCPCLVMIAPGVRGVKLCECGVGQPHRPGELQRPSKGVVYISGPMRGYVDDNYPAFHAATAKWRAAGWEVLNPAEHFGGDHTRTFAEYMRVDIADLLKATAIAMLPGWSASNGAKLELLIAQTLGLEVYLADAPDQPYSWVYKLRVVLG